MHPLDLLDQRGSQRGNQAICASCGGELDIGSWPFCKSRSNPLGHASTMERNAQHFDPVVVFRKPDGSYSIPGRDKSTPPGCERVELRTLREIRQFENLQQHNDHIQWERKCEEDARVFGPLRQNSRSDLLQKSQHFTPRGRDLVRAAIKRNNERRAKQYESGFHSDAFN